MKLTALKVKNQGLLEVIFSFAFFLNFIQCEALEPLLNLRSLNVFSRYLFIIVAYYVHFLMISTTTVTYLIIVNPSYSLFSQSFAPFENMYQF